jgi:hypothetical protein
VVLSVVLCVGHLCFEKKKMQQSRVVSYIGKKIVFGYQGVVCPFATICGRQNVLKYVKDSLTLNISVSAAPVG